MSCNDSVDNGGADPDAKCDITSLKQPTRGPDILAEARYFANVGQLTEQTRKMKFDFSRLAIATMRSLKTLEITPRQLLDALEPAIAQECKIHSSTTTDIFASLCTHLSFFNYGLLEKIISKFEDQNVRRMLDEYKTAIESYCTNPLRQLPPNALASVDQNHRKTRLTRLCMKLDAEWTTATLKDVQGFRQHLALILGIEEEVLNLCSVEEGCVMTKFLIFRSVADELFGNGLCKFQRQALKKMNVLQMECDHPCYTWIAKFDCVKSKFGKHTFNAMACRSS